MIKRVSFLSIISIALFFISCDQQTVSSEISPPGIHGPIYDGAETIGYKHCNSGLLVKIYANKTEYLGKAKVPPWGFGTVKLNRPLKIKDIITAVQSTDKEVGYQTWNDHAVAVENVASDKLIKGEKLYPPKIETPIYDCQKGFKVRNFVEGANISYEILNAAAQTGNIQTPYSNTFILLNRELKENEKIKAKQKLGSLKESDYTKQEVVQAKPKTLKDSKYTPVIKGKYCEGATLVTVCNLIPGADVTIYSKDQKSGPNKVIGSGVAGGYCTFFSVSPLKSQNIEAYQELCSLKSNSSIAVTPMNKLWLPEIKEPICEGAMRVEMNRTELSATVEIKVKRKGQSGFVVLGSSTASSTCTYVNIGGGIPLKKGDQVIAQQSTTSLKSGWTKPSVVIKYEAGKCECYPPESYTLNVERITQEASNWCWAATGQMVMKYFGKDVTQCEQAALWLKKSDNKIVDCCKETSIPSVCDISLFPLLDYYNFTEDYAKDRLTWEQVKEEIFCKKKPYYSRVTTSYGPHWVVVIGYTTSGGKKYLVINDPSSAYMGGAKWKLHKDHCNNSGGGDNYNITYWGK